MSDPIRPFINLVESIAGATSAQKTREATPQSTAVRQSHRQNSNENIAISFTERLKARLSLIDRKDRKKRRQVFIELALLSELGEQLATDHALGELIDKVSTLMATSENIVGDLDNLLDKVESTVRL